jgi:hypothetical protein
MVIKKSGKKVIAKLPEKVKIHYIKTPQFRNIFISGVYGGGALGINKIYMGLFSDRMPFPQITVSNVENGMVTSENNSEKISKDGIIRDVEANVILDLATAKILVNWLQEKIKGLENAK